MVSIIIPTKNQFSFLNKCIDSIKTTIGESLYELIIVDNGSNEKAALEYLKLLSLSDRVTVLRDNSDFNFSSLNNLAVAHAKGDILLFVNNDIEAIEQGWLEAMQHLVSKNNVGCVGCKLLYPDQRIQHAGIAMGLGGVAGHVDAFANKDDCGYQGLVCCEHQVAAVTGACMMIKKSLFLAVGGFNEKDLAISYNDVDLCLRVYSMGYKNLYTPSAELYHHESISRGSDLKPEHKDRFHKEQLYMYKKWFKYIWLDPFYGRLGNGSFKHSCVVVMRFLKLFLSVVVSSKIRKMNCLKFQS